ncbi:MAG TPA: dienelactone hydrolase family protein [Kofleriaceae bacterium]|nr:dienelactone hydrolase family protein [Kofleriaceae bacterium]
MGTMIQLTASDGHHLAAYRADPQQGAARGGVVVIQEIFGVNSHIRAVTDGFAADGYVAVAPAMFDRVERGIDIGYTADTIAKGRELRAGVALDDAMRDVAAAVEAASGKGKVGLVGYCWGGYVAWMAAARVGGLAAVVSYYGGGVIESASEQPRCPVMLHFGERDSISPPEGIRAFRAAQPAAAVHVYEADHGFNCDQRGSHHKPSADLARDRTVSFFREHVG